MRVEPSMTAEDAAALFVLAESSGVRCWVMGGWGVDALLGSQTRPHHDLDLLVLVDDLPRLCRAMESEGFERQRIWDGENEWVSIDGTDWPTAFVLGDANGREIDVHAVEITTEGGVIPRCVVPWVFADDALSGSGRIGETIVACLSASGQMAARGYDLPDHHKADLEALARRHDHT